MSGREPIATIAKLCVYPVKSMAGIAVEEVHVGIDGILGDRQYAFVQSDKAATSSFPWMTGRENARMLAYQPQWAEMPSPEKPEPMVRVRTPQGQVLDVSDPALLQELANPTGRPLFLLRNGRGMFDCQDISLFSLASVQALSAEAGCAIDPRRFRANVYIEPASGQAFEEEKWAGRALRIGEEVVGGMSERDSRCVMINLDPDSGRQDPNVLKAVAQGHQGKAGIYVKVFRTGKIRVGDAVRWAETG